MIYRQTPDVQAVHVPKDRFERDRIPGSFYIDDGDLGDDSDTFWYCCPCGCGTIGALAVGNGFKPAESPSWKWNGSFGYPDLKPSVHHTDHWHGWLNAGVWQWHANG